MLEITLHTTGTRTKHDITGVLNSYNDGKKLENQTGAGDLEKKKKYGTGPLARKCN